MYDPAQPGAGLSWDLEKFKIQDYIIVFMGRST